MILHIYNQPQLSKRKEACDSFSFAVLDIARVLVVQGNDDKLPQHKNDSSLN